MKISVKTFKDEPLVIPLEKDPETEHWARTIIQEAYRDIHHANAPLPLTGALRLQKTGHHIDLAGEVNFEVEVACNRCLDTVAYPISLPLRITFIPNAILQQEDEASDAPTDLLDATVWTYQNDEVDLDEAIYENIVLSIPYTFICSFDCKGLCPTCGVNLNRELCQCAKLNIDPRLQLLKGWKGNA